MLSLWGCDCNLPLTSNMTSAHPTIGRSAQDRHKESRSAGLAGTYSIVWCDLSGRGILLALRLGTTDAWWIPTLVAGNTRGAYYVTKGNRRVIGTNSQSFLHNALVWNFMGKLIHWPKSCNRRQHHPLGLHWMRRLKHIYWIIISQKDGCILYVDIFRNFRSSSIVRNTHKTITSTPLNMSTWLQGE